MTGSLPTAQTSTPRRLVFFVAVLVPLALAAWLRFSNLGGLEPFVDEGANILTGLDPRVRAAFDPLGQGRPLLAVQFQPAGWFPAAPLTAARAMTALAGLVTMSALAWVLLVSVGRGAALLGLWLLAVMPFAVWHERLALQDPFVSAFLALMLSVVTAASRPQANRRWSAVGFGVAGLLLGGAFLTKISVLIAAPWLALVFIGIRHRFGRPILVRGLLFCFVGALVPVLLLGRDLSQLGAALQSYEALPALSAANHSGAAAGLSFAAITARSLQWLEWYRGYGGWSLALLLAAGGAALIVRRDRFAFLSGAGWLLTLVTSGLIYNNAHARYAHPNYLPLVLCLAASLGPRVAKNLASWKTGVLRGATAIALISLGGWLLASRKIADDPRRAAVPADEIAQYVTGPWSGAGIAEVNRFLQAQLAQNPGVDCTVLTHRFLRPGCYALMLAALGDPHLAVVPVTIYEPEELARARDAMRHAGAASRTSVFILYEGSLYPAAPWLGRPGTGTTLVLDVPHGENERWRLFRCDL